MKTHYDTLQVSHNASQEVITVAYRSLSHKYHPDKNSGDLNAQDIMKLINVAYEVLSDPDKRKDYDISIKNSNLEAFNSVYTKNNEASPTTAESRPKNGIVLGIIFIALIFTIFIFIEHNKKSEIEAETLSNPFAEEEKIRQQLEDSFRQADSLIIGENIPKNYKLALIQYQALLGKFEDGRVERRIGEIYYNGFGVKKNFAEAASWFKKSIKAYSAISLVSIDPAYKNYSDSFSLLMLAKIYQNGLGVPKSNIKAYHYYNLAASIDPNKYLATGEARILELRGVSWFTPFNSDEIPPNSFGSLEYQNYAIFKRKELALKLTTSEMNEAQNLIK
jgi:curved DNA-binding protein CbpA